MSVIKKASQFFNKVEQHFSDNIGHSSKTDSNVKSYSSILSKSISDITNRDGYESEIKLSLINNESMVKAKVAETLRKEAIQKKIDDTLKEMD